MTTRFPRFSRPLAAVLGGLFALLALVPAERAGAEPRIAMVATAATVASGGAESDDRAAPRAVANWVTGDLTAALRAADRGDEDFDAPTVEPDRIAELIGLVADGRISHGSGRKVLALLVEGDESDIEAIVEREGLAQMGGDGDELAAIVAAAIEGDPAAAEQIRSGNGRAIGAIVGAVMRETKGRADGGEVNRLIREQLGL